MASDVEKIAAVNGLVRRVRREIREGVRPLLLTNAILAGCEGWADVDVAAARRHYAAFRAGLGYSGLGSWFGTSPKTEHADEAARAGGVEWRTFVLYLAPARIAGFEACEYRTPGCTAACLFHSGKGAMDTTVAARVVRTLYLGMHPAYALRLIVADMERLAANNQDADRVMFRFNGTSDVPIERIPGFVIGGKIAGRFDAYDYTKYPAAARPGVVGRDLVEITFSHNERDGVEVEEEWLARGADTYTVVAAHSARKATGEVMASLPDGFVNGDNRERPYGGMRRVGSFKAAGSAAEVDRMIGHAVANGFAVPVDQLG